MALQNKIIHLASIPGFLAPHMIAPQTKKGPGERKTCPPAPYA